MFALMRQPTLKPSFFALVLFCLILITQPALALSWFVYYGDFKNLKQWPPIDIAIFEADHLNAQAHLNGKTNYYGYLSLGEAEISRPYFQKIKGAEFVLDKNPNWPSHYIDIRSKTWQKIVLEELIPQILKKGYQGVFLDTIDTAAYLENKDPKKYAGSKKEMVDFIKKIRKTYPLLKIIPNNGLELLKDLGPVIDGVLVEDLHTQYHFKSKTYKKTPQNVSESKSKILKEFMMATKKPVFSIVYAKNPKGPLAEYGIKASQDLGVQWYVTTVDLMHLGRISP